jgi:DNA gyrase subunit A
MSDNRIVSINLEEEIKTAYIDYSMSVIVSRALPDVRDGLKPVHRRVLYGMSDLGVEWNKAHKKSARIVGEVLGKYHPHGDSSVYDTMVRLAQPWSMRYPLVDGQGNFGSVDGDSPAAMRYTEARLTRLSSEILADLDKDTVDFKLNFDDTLTEPTVMPTKVPNLLINGASGIAVGMATNMAPHNLREVVDGIIATIANPDITVGELMEHIKAPDFPTGGILMDMRGVRDGYETGRGRVVMRGRATIETSDNGKDVIIITEIPYQVNKSILVMKIAELVNEKKIEGISDIRDESDRTGMRIVIELKRDAISKVVLNKLYSLTPLQSSFGINNVALVNGRPMTLGLKMMITEFIKFRLQVIVRRTQYDLRKAEERAHILEGYMIALDHLDEIIALIRASKNPEEAKEGLISNFALSEIQAKAILELRLQRLTGMERDKIREEYAEIQKLIGRLKEILGSEDIRKEIIVEELKDIKTRFGDDRRSEISIEEGDIVYEDMIAQEDVVVTISHLGYIKRTKLDDYRVQGRGGRGSKGTKTRDEDFVEQIYLANTHHTTMFFTEKGKCFWLKVWELPEGSKTTMGRAIQNIINIPPDDKVKACIVIEDIQNEEFINNHYIIFCTKQGVIKKTLVEEFSRPRQGGIIAIGINEGDNLLEVRLTNGTNEIILANRKGRAIRFNESTVRSMGRNAAGVRGITLDGENDWVVGMVCVDPNDPNVTILTLSENGQGKRSNLDEYRVTNRGGKGVKTMNITAKTGLLAAIKSVYDGEDLMIINKSGIAIRTPVSDISVMGRATQGVRIIRIDENDEIGDVTVIREQEVPEELLNSEMETAISTAENEGLSTPDITESLNDETDIDSEDPIIDENE